MSIKDNDRYFNVIKDIDSETGFFGIDNLPWDLPSKVIDPYNDRDFEDRIIITKGTFLTYENLKMIIRYMEEPEDILDYVSEVVEIRESIWDSVGKDLDIHELKKYSWELTDNLSSSQTSHNGTRGKIIDVLTWCQRRKNEIGHKILPKSTIQFIPDSELDINELALRQEYNFLEDYMKKLEEIIK